MEFPIAYFLSQAFTMEQLDRWFDFSKELK